MGILHEIGIVTGKDTQAAKIFEKLFPNFMEMVYVSYFEYINKCWSEYRYYVEDNNLGDTCNGEMFEYILATLFIKENLMPLYLQPKVAFVPNVNFDLMIYTKERGPICISAKTSLRERYKQADLEAMALKNVYRKSLSYLVTLDKTEAKRLKSKIESGDTLGLDDVIIADEPEFDLMISKLKEFEIIDPPEVKIIEASKIITKENVKNIK